MLKYLLILFVVLAVALAGQVRWGTDNPNPFEDGRLMAMPMPPARRVPPPPMLPPPVLRRVESPALSQGYSGARLEIYDPQAGTGRMEQTLEAGRADWGLRTGLNTAPMDVASRAVPRPAQIIPVNTPVPVPEFDPKRLAVTAVEESVLADLLADIDEWQGQSSDTVIAARDPVPVSEPSEAASPTVAAVVATPSPEEAIAVQPDQTVLATNSPRNLISSEPLAPNLYLPEGATDEEGSALTLILPELHLYKLPDSSSEKSPYTLRGGDRVRPQTRLRNQGDFDWIKVSVDGENWWAQAEYFIRVDPRNKRDAGGNNMVIGSEKVDRDSALPVNYKPNDLKSVPDQYTFGRRDIELRAEAAQAFEDMAQEAERQKLNIRIFSGFRDFDHQKKLYIQAIDQNGPKQNGTAAPGYSEHQLGTTADISGPDRRTVLSGRFGETPEGRWLHENSERFGFRKSYTSENTEEVGYKPEPWHFRYIGKSAIGASSTDTASR